MKTKNTQKAFSLVEMMIYIAILSLVIAALITTANSVINTYGKMKAYEEIAHTGTVALERITREVRRARSVDFFSSVLGVHPGRLVMLTQDWSGNTSTAIVSLSSGRILVQNGGSASPVSTSGVTINNLVFTQYTTPNSEGVLIEFTVEKTGGGTTLSKQFRTFTVLDG